MNRAASIGLALPCVVPREWISPPDVETAEGELLEGEEEGDESHEGAGMMAADRRRQQREEERRWREEEERRKRKNGESEDAIEEEGESLAGGKRIQAVDALPPPRVVSRTDNEGRPLPVAERAPLPKRASASSSTM